MRVIGSDFIRATNDLTKFVRCEHATFLDYGTKTGAITPLARRPPSAMTELIIGKGEEHEHAYVERLRAKGAKVVTIAKEPWSIDALRRAEAETLAAMRSGADYICQAAFFDGEWNGYASGVPTTRGAFPRRMSVAARYGFASRPRSTTAAANLCKASRRTLLLTDGFGINAVGCGSFDND